MHTNLDFWKIPEEQRVAFYGALFAMSAADGAMNQTELGLIFNSLDLENMSPDNRAKVKGYLVEPPPITECLHQLNSCSDELRFSLMVQLVEVALVDLDITEEEETALHMAKEALGITTRQLDAIENFVRQVKRVNNRGVDDAEAKEALSKASRLLTETGVPASALLFSASTIELGAAGITSGLAALGMGLGIIPGISMIPGVGISMLIALSVYSTTKWFFSISRKKKERRLEIERHQRLEFLVSSLEDTVATIAKRLYTLQKIEEKSKEDEEAIRSLSTRLKAIKSLLSWRRTTIPPPPF